MEDVQRNAHRIGLFRSSRAGSACRLRSSSSWQRNAKMRAREATHLWPRSNTAGIVPCSEGPSLAAPAGLLYGGGCWGFQIKATFMEFQAYASATAAMVLLGACVARADT
jgi:hypothetical protein